MTDDRVMLGVRIPSELKRFVDADERKNQDVVEAALWREFGGSHRKDALERRREEMERRLTMVRSEWKERQREMEEIERDIEALEEKADRLPSPEEAYENALQEYVDKLEDGVHVWADQSGVKKNARDHDVTPEQFIDDLRARVSDGVSEDQFEPNSY